MKWPTVGQSGQWHCSMSSQEVLSNGLRCLREGKKATPSWGQHRTYFFLLKDTSMNCRVLLASCCVIYIPFQTPFSKYLLKTWSAKRKSCISSTLLKLHQKLSIYPSVFHGTWGWKRAYRSFSSYHCQCKTVPHCVFLGVYPGFNDSSKGAFINFLQRLFSTVKDFTVKKQFLTLSLKYSLVDFSIHLDHTYILYGKSQTAPSYIIQSFKS